MILISRLTPRRGDSHNVGRTARREAAREEPDAACEVIPGPSPAPGPAAHPARGVSLEAVGSGIDHAHDTHEARLHLWGVVGG